MQTLKSLLITLIILGGVFLAYDCYLAPDANKLVFKKPPSPKPVPPQPPPAPPPPAPSQAALPTTVMPPPAPESVTPPPVAPPPQAAPPMIEPSPAVAEVTVSFVPPSIPDVTAATQNWTRIPQSAFPRVVKLKKPATFKAKFGSTQVAAGTEVMAVAGQQNMLTISPNAASTLRGTVPIDDTNLKVMLTGLYDAWRDKRISAARVAWEQRKDMPEPVVVNAVMVTADGKPIMEKDGTYPLLLASMKVGQVTEVTPKNIKKWGQAEPGDFKGQKCWKVPVDFDAATAFGVFSTVAVARVVDGKVADWTYRDSGESIP
ncbi:hypothetical protein AYO49_01955 [Verrucomicrobiaceae bacterium SCGC AG-212-N21]|nr:hypothetical protein AYO49_01955 [Verrucomicrobiaceae bacterium SCGC AG-212-N21]